jgi:hypothetical protein
MPEPIKRSMIGLMKEVLAEAAGRPIEQVDELLDKFLAARPAPGDRDLSEVEYQAIRASLRGDLPGIRRWLAEGAK